MRMEIFERARRNVDTGSVVIYFCIKNDRETVPIKFNLGNHSKEKIREIALEVLKKCEKYSIEKYNPIGAISNTLEKTTIEEFEMVKELIDSLEKPGVSDDITAEDVNFVIYEFRTMKGISYFMRRYTKLQIFKKGFLGRLMDDKFEKLDASKLLGIDATVDIIVDGHDILIIQHTAFERIFDLDGEFVEAAKEVLSNPKLGEKIEGFKQLKEDLLDNGSYVKRVSKLKNRKNAMVFLDAPENTKKAIDEFRLNIPISPSNKYVYTEKSQLGEFINLMQDAYYKTIIGGEKGTDERR